MRSHLLVEDSDSSHGPGEGQKRAWGPGAQVKWIDTDMKSTGNFTVERPPTLLGTLAWFLPLCTDSPFPEGTRG